MQITVIGTGFVGVVTSAVLASFGHKVYGLDIDPERIAKLSAKKAPFYEPGLEELIKAGVDSKHLLYTTDYKQAIPDSDIVIIAVNTPAAENGTANLQYVFKATETFAPLIKNDTIIAIKSTVPPGTNAKVKAIIEKHTAHNFYLASLPEFLREGSAVSDTLHPDRLVIGASDEKVIKTLLDLHQPLGGERVIVSPESAQMAKYTANAYLAQRITFINQIANLCEKNGAKISEVIQAIGHDKRIGSHYWFPGLGYGGSCFPKDVKELAAYAKSVGEGDGLLVKIDELNERRIQRKLTHFDSYVGGFNGKRVLVLGLSFKPNTNDMRFAPSLEVIPFIQKQGGIVAAYDPESMADAQKIFKDVEYQDSPYKAAENADVIILLIEWPELISLDIKKLYTVVNHPCYFIDTRNQYDSQKLKDTGFHYLSIGNS